MSYERIERELHIEASPEVVFSVLSRPEHMKQWWPDEAEFAAAPGARGQISFLGDEPGEVHVYGLTLVDVDPPRRFSFRWCYPEADTANSGNSLLVTFDLTPCGAGTLLRMTEIGFRDQGRTEAEVVEQYESHVEGWALHLPRISPCVGELVARS
ncbi:polyketide cyclase [Mycobacterium sp. CBMA271]|uniref:SRPBCC family protein n=1 Tax=unclassified Mycobacteroides TaxID=2618759 RepID=UPI0012DFC31F|nr:MULTISPECIES: SRPBCC family protein [unclassified Mycobacteroides]MUM18670.1 polyketide cyclase [Mycobacteroides sp. CBMA 326]MUM22632.1 polyketide cyclase [Mycobacteroides sp. CBMA 271]